MLGINVSAIVGLNIDSKYRESIIDEILKLEAVRQIYEVTGRFDLIVEVRARSLDELHDAVTQNMGRVTGVLHTETFIEMKKKQRDRSYLMLAQKAK
jgi:Lrp/AsnC family transcriptional regulator for asnA, asnC and gidA